MPMLRCPVITCIHTAIYDLVSEIMAEREQMAMEASMDRIREAAE